jgi:hypothetical protein
MERCFSQGKMGEEIIARKTLQERTRLTPRIEFRPRPDCAIIGRFIERMTLPRIRVD